MKPSRRKFLTVTGSAAVASVAGVGSASATTAASDIPIPDNTSMMYPTMGTSADNPTATIYGNFKCPFTQAFVWGNLQEIIDEYVVTGKMNIRFRQLAYEPNEGVVTHGQGGTFISSSDPRIGAGSLAVWDVQPEDYWSYFYTMFSELVSGTVTADDLAERMEQAGVDDIDEIVARIESGRYADLVQESTADARGLGVDFTPTFEVADEIRSPRHDVDDVLSFIESNVSDAVSRLPQETIQETETEEPSSTESDEEPSSTESDEEQSEQETVTTITFDGSSVQGWANYKFTVSGSFEKTRTMSAKIEDGDSFSGSTAEGGVGSWTDTYTYTGKITNLELTQAIDIYRNGEPVDLDALNAEVETNQLETTAKTVEDNEKRKTGFETEDGTNLTAACSRF